MSHKRADRSEGPAFRTLYYLGYYRSEYIAERKPAGSSAQDYKMTYLIRSMKKLGYRVVVVSLLASGLPGCHRRKTVDVDALEKHVYLESFDILQKPLCKLTSIIRLLVLFRFLLFTLRKKDTLLVYHNQLFSIPVRLAKVLKRFRLLLEIEEIFYQEARTARDVRRKNMECALIKASDGFLAINERVRSEYCASKPAVISYGSYDMPPKYAERYDDGRIHLVYAGIINATHGAHAAVELMHYLDENYRLHIYGFGLDKDIDCLKQLIAAANNRFGEERICYHGTKSGSDFDVCLQRCHIGLNFNITLNPDSGKYAYPSKIPAYLGHGLNVLTYRIPCVENSELARGVQFYDQQEPEAIARAIRDMTIRSYESQVELLRDFDRIFSGELQALFREVRTHETKSVVTAG